MEQQNNNEVNKFLGTGRQVEIEYTDKQTGEKKSFEKIEFSLMLNKLNDLAKHFGLKPAKNGNIYFPIDIFMNKNNDGYHAVMGYVRKEHPQELKDKIKAMTDEYYRNNPDASTAQSPENIPLPDEAPPEISV